MAKSRRMKRGGENTFTDETSSSSTSSTPSSTMGGRRRRRGSRRSRRGGLALPTPAVKPAAPAAAPPSIASALSKLPPSHPVIKAVAAAKGGRRRGKRGGDGGADWVLKNFGNGNQQWDNTFTNSGSAQQGNLLPTLPGAPAVGPNNNAQSSLKGGSRRRSRSRRGGYWAQVLNQALVPFGLVGLQNRFSRRRAKK